MQKKFILFSALVSLVFVGNALAIPTVRKMGANVSTATQTSPSVVKSNKVSGATVAKSATTPAVRATIKPNTSTKTSASVQTERFPAVSNFNSVLRSYKQGSGSNTGTTPTPSTPVTSGVSESDFAAVENRVTTLEQNTVTEVTEETSEPTSVNYVSGVSMEGNTLNVRKTNKLYAPVKSQNSNTTTGMAEIWIIK